MTPGIGRELVLAVGRPRGWIAKQLPLASVAHTATAWLNPEPSLSGPVASTRPQLAGGGQIPPVTPAAFDPQPLGDAAPPAAAAHAARHRRLDVDAAGQRPRASARARAACA